ncbi:hypothetical protein NCH01_17890 [Neoasaia chiangmaiensis]|uniref:Uncharacterized protein n=3 Tax=Neoasaia chiangmaiensis TaxID=320497 RepID=A0A1U9KRS1_9PROT|nr:DUF2142 domain-containing protein [Neoasaia chiangmaiensis]AQS88526.1 hypothetical protein A0U93_11925 [Neoasaia chiangmaiensis]GEN15358.1 hypothetical protein NCH01_17890 [Neoasaia chiangmaiensis]
MVIKPSSRRLATIFLPFAILLIVGGSFLSPPFQVLDEASHFLRAIQVAQGGLIGIKTQGQSGGYVPANVLPLLHRFDTLRFHTDRKASPAVIADMRKSTWTGPRALIGFPNTVTYGPFCYLPQAAAIRLGQILRLPILDTFYIARLMNGMVFALLCTAAIAIAMRGTAFLLLICSLPMSIDLAASLSQDGPLIAANALLAALLSRYETRSDFRWPRIAWVGFGLAFGILGTAKPPELVLSLLPCAIASRADRPVVVLCPVIAAIQTLGWLIFCVAPIKLQFLPELGVSDRGQFLYLLHHPTAFPSQIARSLVVYGNGYLHQFIGVLAWMDTPVPAWFVEIGSAALLCALWPGLRPGLSLNVPGIVRGSILASIMLLAAAAIFLSLDVIWTPVGASVIHGVHGRYFLPVACFSILFLPFGKARGPIIPILLTAWLCVATAVFIHTLAARFW